MEVRLDHSAALVIERKLEMLSRPMAL